MATYKAYAALLELGLLRPSQLHQEKSPAQGRAMKVWERMPERHYRYGEEPKIVQMRKPHKNVHFLQHKWRISPIYNKCCRIFCLIFRRPAFFAHLIGFAVLRRSI